MVDLTGGGGAVEVGVDVEELKSPKRSSESVRSDDSSTGRKIRRMRKALEGGDVDPEVQMVSSDTSTTPQKKSKNGYSIEDAVRFVVVNNLHPMEALRAAKSPCSKQVLSYHVNRYRDEARQKQVINIETSDDPTISSISSVCSLTSYSSSGSSKKMKRIRRSSAMVSKMRAQVIQKKRGEEEQFDKALKEGLKLYTISQEKKLKRAKFQSAESICQEMNGKYLQECVRKLVRPTLQRYFQTSTAEVLRRGPPPKISNTLLRVMSIHCTMKQVSGKGEAKPKHIRSVLYAAVKNTPHEKMRRLRTYTGRFSLRKLME